MLKHHCSFLFYFMVGMKRLSEMFTYPAFGNLRPSSCCRQGCLEPECRRSYLPKYLNCFKTHKTEHGKRSIAKRLVQGRSLPLIPVVVSWLWFELISVLVVLSVFHAGLCRRCFKLFTPKFSFTAVCLPIEKRAFMLSNYGKLKRLRNIIYCCLLILFFNFGLSNGFVAVSGLMLQ
jgi:hypothetical protein